MTSRRTRSLLRLTGWSELRDRGAVLDATRVLHFGDPDGERAALPAAPTLHPLPDWSILRAAGADAAAFLQGQLSNDIDMLDSTRAQLSTYCTAQGRMLASLLAVARRSRLFPPAPSRDRRRACVRRLQKYVLRAAVTLADTTAQLRLLGLGGPGASAALAGLVDPPPASAPMAIARGPEVTVIRVHEQELFEIVVPARHWSAVWDHLTGRRVRPGPMDGAGA